MFHHHVLKMERLVLPIPRYSIIRQILPIVFSNVALQVQNVVRRDCIVLKGSVQQIILEVLVIQGKIAKCKSG